MGGAGAAVDEITLVLFTTLAPSGVMALMLLCAPALAGRASDEERVVVDRVLWVPLVVALVGLVASATHLGNPANALYVIMGVGRSPLSNEVFCAAVFFGIAGAYWITSFSNRPHKRLRRLALVPLEVVGALFITAVAFAYDAGTILTWHSPFVPAALWLNALVGGPVLALLTLRMSKRPALFARFERMVACLSLFAWVANVAVYVVQSLALEGVQNHMTTAMELVSGYPTFVGMFALLTLAGIVYASGAAWGKWRAGAAHMAGAAVLVLAGIFVMRFAFYMMHLTVGL